MSDSRDRFNVWMKENHVYMTKAFNFYNDLNAYEQGMVFVGWQAAEQENADLRAQLAAANKRLEDAEKQEPVLWFSFSKKLASMPRGDGNRLIGFIVNSDDYPFDVEAALTQLLGKLYTRPIPTADVAELQRKLAEQQESMLCLGNMIAVPIENLNSLATEELNTLLAKAREEGRKEAVPGGLVETLSEAANIMAGERHMRFPIIDELRGFAAMLSAAPKPEGDKK